MLKHPIESFVVQHTTLKEQAYLAIILHEISQYRCRTQTYRCGTLP